jgi:hypothetical protein
MTATDQSFEDWYATEGWKYAKNKTIAKRIWDSIK